MSTGPDNTARCPGCGAKDIRRSHTRGSIFDSVMEAFHRLPFRCRQCSKRFYRHVPVQKTAVPEHEGETVARDPVD